jgi:hypothetical protein
MDAAVTPELIRAQKRWDHIFLRCYLPYVAVGGFLAATIPASGLTGLDALIDAVADFVPSIDRISRVSPMPDMTRAFGALMWLVYPFFTLWVLFESPRTPIRKVPWGTLLFIIPLCIACLVFLGIYFPFFFREGPPRLGYSDGRGVAGFTFIISSRFGHGTLGALMFVMASFSVVITWRLLRDYPSLLIHNIRSRL